MGQGFDGFSGFGNFGGFQVSQKIVAKCCTILRSFFCAILYAGVDLFICLLIVFV